MRCSTFTAETLASLATEIHDSAATYAISRLLERRPELDRPPQPHLRVPAAEALRVCLDRVAFVAWLEQALALVADVPVAGALRAGATWGQVAGELRCTVEEARERYQHLALIAAVGDAPAAGPDGGEVA